MSPRNHRHAPPRPGRTPSVAHRRPAYNHRPARSRPFLRTLPPSAPLSLDPTNPFEVLVAEQIKAMRQDLDRLESRLWWLFGLILAAAAADILTGLFA